MAYKFFLAKEKFEITFESRDISGIIRLSAAGEIARPRSQREARRAHAGFRTFKNTPAEDLAETNLRKCLFARRRHRRLSRSFLFHNFPIAIWESEAARHLPECCPFVALDALSDGARLRQSLFLPYRVSEEPRQRVAERRCSLRF